MASITLKDVVKTYPGAPQASVKGVSLEIPDGSFCVLVGPSGCGKSTLLRMIAGLETVSGGEIRIGERVVNDLEPVERDIAMVFQNYALYPHMSVRKNLSYGLKNRKMPKAEIETRVAEAARILQIDRFLDRKPRHLSGGQRQRVAMGRAIVRDPAAFLFDEPLSNLDAKLRVQMRGEIKQLQKRLGATSVYVTHDQLEAMTLADTLVVLNNGQIEQAGKPLDLYRDPQTVFVAGFIGSPGMNLIEGQIVSGSLMIGTWEMADGIDLPDMAVLAGLRPEALGFVPDAAGPVSLDYIEDLGGQRLIHGVLDGQKIVAQMTPDTPLAAKMGMRFDAADILLFDALNGQRLRQRSDTAQMRRTGMQIPA